MFALVGCLPLLVHEVGIEIPPMPWPPVAVLGTAVAFITGFRSNAAYGRLWEARQVWGGIINSSRSFGVALRDQVQPFGGLEHTRRFVHRHLAWLTALRHFLRQPRAWETAHLRHNAEYRNRIYTVPEDDLDLDAELRRLVSEDEWSELQHKRGKTSAILALQSADLARLAEQGALSDYRHVELARFVTELFDLQGKCERIKNFPYPRQFATLNRIFVWMFIVLLPFAIASELLKQGIVCACLTIPLTVVIAWVFHTMDKIGTVSENPFEGSANDVPITAMSRTIEIDLLELLGEKDLPAAATPKNEILM